MTYEQQAALLNGDSVDKGTQQDIVEFATEAEYIEWKANSGSR